MTDEKAYPQAFEEHSSHGHAVALLDKAGLSGGLVLDLGCGNAPPAEPLAQRGYEYVGLDVGKASLDGLAERGFETHRVDLGVNPSRLTKKLREVVDGRELVAILALDVLEHVVDPSGVVRALATVAQAHPGCSLVVSVPNVTHRDVAARLLLGRWDLTPVGLLDDTHLRFFSPERLHELFAGTGWREVDAFDTTAEYTEQYTLLRTPALQPGAPVGDFLRRVRAGAAGHATTYQFIRRLTLDAESEEQSAERESDSLPFLTVIVTAAGAGAPAVLEDLERQTDADYEVILVGEGQSVGDVDGALVAAKGHYVSVVDATDRLGRGFVAAVRSGAGEATDPVGTDCVVRVSAVALSGTELARGSEFDALVERRVPIEPDGFDVLRADLRGRTALSAYAVPASAIRTLGLRFDVGSGPAAGSVFLARAVELCSLRGVDELQVAVDERRVRAADDDLDAVREGLGTGAFLLPPGGVERLAAHRRRERALRSEVDDLRPRVTAAEDERRRLRAELDAIRRTRTWRYSRRARALYLRARALIADRRSR